MLGEREAHEDVKNDEINTLKQKISELAYKNNRYHLAISNCTFCASDDEPDNSDASCSDVSILASTPKSLTLPSSDSDPVLLSSTIPALMSLSAEKTRQANTVERSKDKTFIMKMVKALTKLENK